MVSRDQTWVAELVAPIPSESVSWPCALGDLVAGVLVGGVLALLGSGISNAVRASSHGAPFFWFDVPYLAQSLDLWPGVMLLVAVGSMVVPRWLLGHRPADVPARAWGLMSAVLALSALSALTGVLWLCSMVAQPDLGLDAGFAVAGLVISGASTVLAAWALVGWRVRLANEGDQEIEPEVDDLGAWAPPEGWSPPSV